MSLKGYPPPGPKHNPPVGNGCCFFFNDTATTEIYTLSLHDALPISHRHDLPARVERGLHQFKSANPGADNAEPDRPSTDCADAPWPKAEMAGPAETPAMVARMKSRRLVGSLDTFGSFLHGYGIAVGGYIQVVSSPTEPPLSGRAGPGWS